MTNWQDAEPSYLCSMDLPESLSGYLQDWLEDRYGTPCTILRYHPVSGGCIHHALRLETGRGNFFLKWNHVGEAANFQAEEQGLRLLGRHVPGFAVTPLATGTTDDCAFLLLDFIEQGTPETRFWQDFGHRLAALHRRRAPRFGLDRDNFIGRLPQSNRRHDDFATFFIEERLEPQLRTARDHGLAGTRMSRDFERLYGRLPGLLPAEAPALLHGDLWHGNFLCGRDGQALLIDPAVYYGHRESELAFTLLFGGFAPEFYDAYEGSFPLEPGWRERRNIFNLYPLLVHLNLFGAGYRDKITGILDRFR